MVELRGAWCGGALGAEAASPTCIAQATLARTLTLTLTLTLAQNLALI